MVQKFQQLIFFSKINTLAVVLEGSYASITYGRFHIEGAECSV